MADIEPFEDEDVVGVRLILTKTGDGLSKSLKIAPVILRRHQKVQLVIEADTAKIRFEDTKEKDRDGVDRVQILECEVIAVVDDENVRRLIQQQLAALQRQQELEGQQQLAVDTDDDPDPDNQGEDD